MDKPQIVAVDGHAHLYRLFDFDLALNHAVQNTGAGPDRSALLVLATRNEHDEYTISSLPNSSLWKVRETDEPLSVFVERQDGARLCLIQGRQIATESGLEILIAGVGEGLSDRKGFFSTLEAAQEASEFIQVPWGVGKWIGKRGASIAQTARGSSTSAYLADSGSRPVFWKYPPFLKEAEQNGSIVLAGSDPLPIAGQERALGRYGFLACFALDQDRPFGSFLAWLGSQTTSPERYGKLESLTGFIRNQIILRV